MKIGQTPTDQVKNALIAALVKAYKVGGYNVPPPKDFAEIVNLTYENFAKYFKRNELDDIAVAFEKGSLGEYGENNGLSVSRFHQWMRAYNGKATNQQQEDEEPPMPEQPRNRVADAHNMVNSAYQEWLKRGYNLIPATLILSWLIGDNKIPELRKKTELATAEASKNLSNRFFTHRESFQKLADYITKNQKTETDSLILISYFEECKAAGLQSIYPEP